MELKRHPIGRLGLRLARRLEALFLALDLLAGLAEELAPALRRAQLLGQLITPSLAELLILGLIGRYRLGQDLARDLLEGLVHTRTGVPSDPRAIDRHHPTTHQPSLVAEHEYRSEQGSQRLLVAAYEPRDRRMVRNQIAGDHSVGNVLSAVTLDPPRGAHTGREPVQDQRHHHRRLIRRPAVTVSPIRAIEVTKIHVGHRADHKPRQMISRQPVPHVRRQQEPLILPAVNEVLRHDQMVLIAADGQPFVRQPHGQALVRRSARW
jgi:hypothetical protein